MYLYRRRKGFKDIYLSLDTKLNCLFCCHTDNRTPEGYCNCFITITKPLLSLFVVIQRISQALLVFWTQKHITWCFYQTKSTICYLNSFPYFRSLLKNSQHTWIHFSPRFNSNALWSTSYNYVNKIKFVGHFKKITFSWGFFILPFYSRPLVFWPITYERFVFFSKFNMLEISAAINFSF